MPSPPTIFLSASVPKPERAEAFHRLPNAAFEIEQAVICLARAVFARKGRLVFGGHPSISPLVGIVAGEYRAPQRVEGSEAPTEASVLIYQSEAFRGYAQEDKLVLFQLDLAKVRWTEAVGDERFDPEAPLTGPPCPLSVDAMRRAMLKETRPDAMVAIGGMEGVLDEASLFRELAPGRSVFALAGTGGAAAILADDRDQAEAIDLQVTTDLAARRETAARARGEDGEGSADEPTRARANPYPLIMQLIVDRVWQTKRDEPPEQLDF